ncbi:hypothetical protein CHUAL_013554 [Chamberlinius hualienensis]
MSSKSNRLREEDKRYPLRFDEPKYLTSRIVVSNIDERVIRETLEDKFSRYGRVLGVSMHRGFSYVQFESESAAYSAIKSENDTVFSGNKIDVRMVKDSRKDEKPRFYPVQAGRRRSPPRRESNALRDNYNRGSYRDRSPNRPDELYKNRGDEFGSRSRLSPKKDTDDRSQRMKAFDQCDVRDQKTNDCEIIVFDKAQRTYAEIVEWRLKGMGLQVDLLFPKAESPLLDILEDIGSRGSLYAIVINPQNEVHRSLTVNILWGELQEHRNMPMDDAMQLIAKHYEKFKREMPAQKNNSEQPPVIQNQPSQPVNQTLSREEVQRCLRLLADGKQISIVQLDQVILHLKEFREFLAANETQQQQQQPPPQPTAPIITQGNMVNPSVSEEDLKKTLLQLLGGKSLAGVLNSTAISPSEIQRQAGASTSTQRMINDQYAAESTSHWNRQSSLFNDNSNKVNPAAINLDNSSVKAALDSLLQGGSSKLFQPNVTEAPTIPSNPFANLLIAQQQQQKGFGVVPGFSGSVNLPPQQQQLGRGTGYQSLMRFQLQPSQIQQGNHFPRQFY